ADEVFRLQTGVLIPASSSRNLSFETSLNLQSADSFPPRHPSVSGDVSFDLNLNGEIREILDRIKDILVRNKHLESEVQEYEKEVALREEMEVALKESLREAERVGIRLHRNDTDIEYLKNTLLKMYRTGEAENLLPVFATILVFSPEELQSCRDGLKAIQEGQVPLPGAAAAVDASFSGAANVFNSLTNWASWTSTI
ncbi:hypothetical protein CEUSTIGMA_g8836.t1, partial [Chlamydomonas eustigma]